MPKNIITAEDVFSAEKEESEMVAATAKPKAKPNSKPKTVTETDDDVLARSLSFHDGFGPLKRRGSTDEEILVEIRRRWRQAKVHGPRQYHVEIDHPNFGTAIFLDTLKADRTPTWRFGGKGYKGGDRESLVTAVRRILEIPITIGPDGGPEPLMKPPGDSTNFEKLKASGKSRAKGSGTIYQPVALEIGPIVKFPIGKIYVSPFDKRRHRPEAHVAELAASMGGEDGQLQPCLVRPDGQHIAGFTRTLAGRKLGWKEIDVRVVTCDDATARRLVLIENAKRWDLTEREKMESHLDLLEDSKARGITQKALADVLGLSESALSNSLRLRTLPKEIWERHERGGFSIDQIRKLSLYADRPKFVKAVLGRLSGTCADSAVPEPHHFSSAFDAGVDSAFRRMSPGHFGDGCQFKPNDAQKAELEIVEVQYSDGNKFAAATNIDLWNKLNKEAKAKKEAKQNVASGPKAKQAAQAKKYQDEQRERNFQFALEGCWDEAFARSLADRFAKPKKADHALAIRLRMIIFARASEFDEWAQVEIARLLALSDGELGEECIVDLQEFFGSSEGWDGTLQHEELREIVESLKLEPMKRWRPNQDLIAQCSDEDLRELAEFAGITGTRDEMTIGVIGGWDVDAVPLRFCLKQEKKKGRK